MPGTSRTSTTDTAVQWDSSRTVTRGVSTSVEERRARALGIEKDKRRGGSKPPIKSEGPSEAIGNVFGLLWIAFGGIIILLCAIFVVGSVIMFGVLREISDARNFDAAASQTGAYEDFFKEVGDAGFTVGNDKPNIKEGVTQYLWTVTPPNDGALRVFSWQHDLQTNVIRPTSNAAALLDIELGFIDSAKAQEYAQEGGRQVFQFDTADATANAIIDRNASAFAKNNGEGWGQNGGVIANAPPLPPALFDTKARTRKGVGGGAAAAEEDEEALDEENPAEGDGEQTEDPTAPPAETEPDPEPEPPTEVEPAAPPAEDAGDGNEDGGGDPAPEPPGEDEGDGDGGDATPVG